MLWTLVAPIARLLRPDGGMARCAAALGAGMLAAALLAGCYGSSPASTRMNAGAASSSVQPIVGSGSLVSRTLDIADFNDVEASEAFRVDITKGEAFRVEVTADDNVIDAVDVSKQGSTLRIKMKSGSYVNATYRAKVSMPDVRRLHLSGASNATLSGFAPRTLDLGLSGASKLTGRLEGGKVNLAVREASNATLGGSAEDLTVAASGASQANLGDLATGTARTSLAEASTGTVNVKDRLDVELRSASSLFYVGNPTLGSVSAVEGSSLRHR